VEQASSEARVLLNDGGDVGNVGVWGIEHASEFHPGAGQDWECTGLENHATNTLVIEEIIAIGEMFQERTDDFEAERLAEEAVRDVERFGGFKFVRVSGDDDASCLWMRLHNVGEEVQPWKVGQDQLGDDDVIAETVKEASCFGGSAGSMDFLRDTPVSLELPVNLAGCRVAIYKEDSSHPVGRRQCKRGGSRGQKKNLAGCVQRFERIEDEGISKNVAVAGGMIIVGKH
jgi:hypothetical protein